MMKELQKGALIYGIVIGVIVLFMIHYMVGAIAALIGMVYLLGCGNSNDSTI